MKNNHDSNEFEKYRNPSQIRKKFQIPHYFMTCYFLCLYHPSKLDGFVLFFWNKTSKTKEKEFQKEKSIE